MNKKTVILAIIIISVLVFLYYCNNIENMKENFINNLKEREHKENFDNIPSINEMKKTINDTVNKNNSDANANEVEVNANANEVNVNEVNANEVNVNEVNVNDLNSTNNTCKDGNCLFSCNKDKVENKEVKVEDMMKTIEETEKLCDLIEEKDRIRREKEEEENIEKQIQLNKKFLLQQKSQNQQIEDLQKIVKEMVFTEEITKAGLEKCGNKTEKCLANKEERLMDILEEKKRQSKKVKVNLKLDKFGSDIKGYLSKQLNASNIDIENLSRLINSGQINMEDLKKNTSGSMDNSNDCPNCKIDLTKYIDRCKIPCRKCRDPLWNCPQDK
jgi:hypothetical protein